MSQLISTLEPVQRPQLKLPNQPKLLPNLSAGLAVGLVSLTYSVSFAALIFSGSLSAYFPQGVGSALISSVVVGTIVALRSSFPFAIAEPDTNATAILALIAAAIATEIQRSGRAEQLFPTVGMAIALDTLLTGLLLYRVGHFRLGQWARFIPYPVIGGFLAGTGWLIISSAFTVMTGLPLRWSQLPDLLQVPTLIHWLPGLLFAGVLIGVTQLCSHALVLPGMMLGAIVGFNLLWSAIANFVPLTPQGWFLEPFSSDRLWPTWNATSLPQVDWQVLAHQSGTLLVLAVVVVITLLLNLTGIELATQQDSSLNSELRSNGLANLVVCLCGGMVGHLSLNRTLFNRSAGANSRLAGLTAAGFSGVVLLFGSRLMAYIPIWVLGGVLLMIGIKRLIDWGISSWFKFPHLDYALILIILASMAIWGFISGVAIGVVIACGLFIFSYSRHQVIRQTFSGATHPSKVYRSWPEQRLLRQQGDRIQIWLLQGYLFFGTANSLLEQVRQRLQDPILPQVRFVILDFRLVSGLDSSAVLSFIKLRQFVQKHELRLVLTHLDPTILQQLQHGGCIVAQNSPIQVFPELDRGIEWCEDRILESLPLRRRRALPLALQMNEVFASSDQVSSFIRYLEKVQVPVEQQLFRQGDCADQLYFIESGQVTVVLQLGDGQSRRLQTLGAGMILGETSFYLGTPHKTSAISDQPSTLYGLSKDQLQTLRRSHPIVAAAFQDFMIRLLADRLTYAYEEIEELL
ncbi:MAG: cyclic nucleotide-binding domain-containing protein [Aphanocapsa sp. GSE-SYN-MK-11-07L]|jgi:SulP family sulfate permease|nr:cyclic nucleotide-binding domain-containing protein [Aphanocapsa sp. GSE-SYN-MK-11-07L]